jgi:hypothetical protein
VKSGISLSLIFFVVGSSCVSTDEIFKAIECKKKLEVWEIDRKERKKVRNEKKLHEKGVEAMIKVLKKNPDYDHILRWKMGALAYNADLLPLFEKYNDVFVAPLIVPEETDIPPPLPYISETALDQASTKFVK